MLTFWSGTINVGSSSPATRLHVVASEPPILFGFLGVFLCVCGEGV